MPQAFITLWKSVLNKCFINHASEIDKQISTGISLGNRSDQDVGGKWIWWSVPRESQIYHGNNKSWSYYRQVHRRYYLDDETDTCPCESALPISVVLVTANSFRIQRQPREFVLL